LVPHAPEADPLISNLIGSRFSRNFRVIGARDALLMVGTMWTCPWPFRGELVCVLSGGGLLGGQVLRLGRIFIGVIFVAELRNTVRPR
jgi:hypothetical protein